MTSKRFTLQGEFPFPTPALQLYAESAALFFLTSHFKFSGSPLHVSSPVSEHIPELLSSVFIYRFYWHCCHSKCYPVDKETKKSPDSVSYPETCAAYVAPLFKKPSFPNEDHLTCTW